MLRVDKGGDAAQLLRFGDGVQGDRGFTRRFGTVNFDHSPARKSADPQRQVERQAAGRDHLDIGIARVLPQLHDGAFAVLLFDLHQDALERLCFSFFHFVSSLSVIVKNSGKECFSSLRYPPHARAELQDTAPRSSPVQ